MPISLRALLDDVASVDVPTPAGTLRVTYRPGRITLALALRLQEGAADIPASLAELIAGWDLLGEDGQPLPVTAETIRALPLTLIQAILKTILDDWSLKAKM